MAEALTPEAFRLAIGQFPTGVTVVTTRSDAEDFGTTVSAICPVCADPPMILACLNRFSTTGAAIERSGGFAVNVLSQGQLDLAERFALPGSDFTDVATEPGRHGEPLLTGASARLECRTTELTAHGTHKVFIAAVHRVERRGDGMPLAHFRGRFGCIAPTVDR